VELKTVGSVKYANHPSTEATLLTYAFGRTGTIKVWRKGQPIPTDLKDVAENPHKYKFIAQNILFDYLIWICVLNRLIPTMKRPSLENLDDLMALSCHFRTGASLESAAQMMGLPYSKDKEGRRLMLKQCKPNAKGKFVELTPEEWIAFERYGVMDTRILRDVYYRLPPLPAPERYAWEWTFRRNLRGIRLDEELVYGLNAIVDESLPKLVAEFNHHVGYKCTMNSHVKVKDWFKQYYPWIENMQAETMRDMLAEDRQVPWHVRRALEIKDLAGSTSISKLKSVLDRVHQGRVYELLAYHYAQTKRWAGRGPQIQNFPRPNDKLQDSIDFDMNVVSLASYVRERRPGLKDPIGFVKNLLRRIWLANIGEVFYCGDFSKVEPTVLFWLTGVGAIPKKWYEEMAADIYNMAVSEISKDSEERHVGKTAALSCGYGAGWKSFIEKTYKDTGIRLTEQMSKQVVNAYRRKYPQVVQFWRDLQDAFRLAIYGQSSVLCGGKIHVMPMQHPWKGVCIRLPSGGMLYYHQAKESTEEYDEEIVEVKNGVTVKSIVKKTRVIMKYLADQGSGRIGWDYVYGGLLTENVVSATAREVLTPAMWRLEQAGFDLLGVVHDECWASAAPGRDEEFNYLMCINPSWCQDMEIGSDLKIGARYLK